MKIRIKNSSVRYRITLKDLEALTKAGRIEGATEIYSLEGNSLEGRFVYGVALAPEGEKSRCAIEPGSIMVYLDEGDMSKLKDPSEEGVYLRRESQLDSGETHRFIAFVEKDRPATVCGKPDEWIYQDKPGQRPDTRPIPKGKGE